MATFVNVYISSFIHTASPQKLLQQVFISLLNNKKNFIKKLKNFIKKLKSFIKKLKNLLFYNLNAFFFIFLASFIFCLEK